MNVNEVNLEGYYNTIDHLKAAVKGLNEEHLSWKETQEKWSVKEVLSHLLDHNLITSFRIREVLSEANSPLPGFNQDRWVESTRANEGSINEILDSFQSLLHLNQFLFNRLIDDDWLKRGVTSKGETVLLHEIINRFTNHVHHHIKQISRIIQSYHENSLKKGEVYYGNLHQN